MFAFKCFLKFFTHLVLTALALCCRARAFAGCREWGCSLAAVLGPLIAVASLVAEHRLSGPRPAVVVAHGLNNCGYQVVAPWKKSYEQPRQHIKKWRHYFANKGPSTDGDCSHKIKRCLLFGRKVMTNLDSIFKSKDITLPTKFCLVKAMVFPVVMYRYESWTVKEAECGRIDAFELWCWRRLLRVPWTARRSNLSILKEISPGCSMEGLMLKLKLQYLGHQM